MMTSGDQMSQKKKKIRSNFRKTVLHRDHYQCRVCGGQEQEDQNIDNVFDLLDIHHISPREKMAGGGYVKENGIALCKTSIEGARTCHEKAEEWLKIGKGAEGYDPDTLYSLIGSSYALSVKKSKM